LQSFEVSGNAILATFVQLSIIFYNIKDCDRSETII